MKHWHPLLLFASVLACDVHTPVGEEPPAAFTAHYVTLPVPPAGGSGWVVRVNQGQHEIEDFALTDDHVYFATRDEAVYRVAKTGGSIEVVWASERARVRPMGSFGGDVYWWHWTGGDSGHVLERQRASGARQPIFSAPWGIATATGQRPIHIDASGVYTAASDPGKPLAPILRRVPLDGSAARSLIPLAWVRHHETWVVDDARVFVCRCPEQANECEVEAMPKDGGPLEPIARLPLEMRNPMGLFAVDDGHLYLRSSLRIARVAKTGGALTTLYTPPPRRSIHALPLLEGGTIYFAEDDGTSASYLRALPKEGGQAQAVADSAPVPAGARMNADAGHVYFLRNGREIVAHSKTLAPLTGL